MHHQLNLSEGIAPADSFGDLPEPRNTYLVVAPLFKNGHSYRSGDTIDLTTTTAQAFLAVGDIKELNENF